MNNQKSPLTTNRSSLDSSNNKNSSNNIVKTKSDNKRKISFNEEHSMNTDKQPKNIPKPINNNILSKISSTTNININKINRNNSNDKKNNSCNNINIKEEEKPIQREGKIFGRFYEKYSQNVQNVLKENKEDMDLIGNQRFKGDTHKIDYFLDEVENNNLNNKFYEKFNNGQEEKEQIELILNNPNIELTQEQRDILTIKRRNYQDKIELTPLPIAKRKKLDKNDVQKEEKFNKAQRSAVVMRRFEYEMRMKRLKFEKLNKRKYPNIIFIEKKYSIFNLN